MLTLEPEDIAYEEDRIKAYQETVYCIVLNSKLTHQGLSSKRFKLLKETPFQIKPKLLRVMVNSCAWQVSLGKFF